MNKCILKNIIKGISDNIESINEFISGQGGGSTAITWKYPEMAMYLADKDKFDTIDWETSDETALVQNMNAITESILVGFNECELIYPDTFMEDLQTKGQVDVDLNKNNQRIATITLSSTALTFSNLAGELSNKNIQTILLGQQGEGESVKAGGIITNAEYFGEPLVTIYLRDHMNVGG